MRLSIARASKTHPFHTGFFFSNAWSSSFNSTILSQIRSNGDDCEYVWCVLDALQSMVSLPSMTRI